MPEFRFRNPAEVIVRTRSGPPLGLVAAAAAAVAAVLWVRAHLGEIEFVAGVVVASAVVAVAGCAVASRLLYKRLCPLETAEPAPDRAVTAQPGMPRVSARPARPKAVEGRTAPRAVEPGKLLPLALAIADVQAHQEVTACETSKRSARR